MINLVPKEEKKKLIRNFYYRLAVLFFVILDISLLFVIVAILPSYLISGTKVDIVNAKLEVQRNEPVPVPDQQTLLVIRDLRNKLDLIGNAEKNKFLVSERIINAIIVKKLPEVRITNISYGNDTVEGKKVNIEGEAPSREILLFFRQALESDTVSFKQVDLPISNFVRGTDIQFSLSLVPN